jgi:outer membrane receptor protein involved in Fe transport
VLEHLVNEPMHLAATRQHSAELACTARDKNLGVEASLGWQPVRALHLAASLGLLRARFLDYTPAGVSLAGRDQAQAPQYQFSVAADYHFATGFFAHADVTGKDSYYFSSTTDQRAGAYQLLNLRMGYDGGAWTASVWARNALNRSYATRGFFFGNEPPDYTPKSYLNNGDPRQLGASVSIIF